MTSGFHWIAQAGGMLALAHSRVTDAWSSLGESESRVAESSGPSIRDEFPIAQHLAYLNNASVHADNWVLFYGVSRFASGGRAKRLSIDVRCASSDALTCEPPIASVLRRHPPLSKTTS